MPRITANTDVFQAIADPTRRGILEMLRHEEQPVSALAGQFDVTLSAISQHMRVLREVGLVTVRQAGRERIYRVSPNPLRQVLDWVGPYETFWQDKMDALGENLEDEP